MTARDPNALAGEYALGVLGGEELRVAQERTRTDPAFAAEVARWRGRLAPLNDEVEPAQVPTGVWRRLEASIAGGNADNVVLLRRRLSVWRGAAAAMTALAASLAVVMVTRPPPAPTVVERPAGEPMTAMINAGSELAAVADWDQATRRLVVTEVKMPAVASRDYELWVIPADGKPRSLGVMPNAPRMRVPVSAPMSAMIAKGTMLAVSLEPRGGSPSDGPTGPVVASGPIVSA